MNTASRIVPFLDLLPDIEELRAEAAAEGFRFLDRPVSEWQSGRNRFARSDEVFLGAFRASELAAVGGLNHDPHADQDGVGRLRHIYVRRSARHSGAGSALVRQLLDFAEGIFYAVRLRTETEEAANFYRSLGFETVQDRTATHVRVLKES